ncbi:hydantoinase/oxoprolinase family protein [Henriciella aquimarina]|uniref:hydantoinase/oxoprolinase family protein n=1 Tax=Henriciella aquimarina TaxID=545261 RepID=UPI001301ABCF|nr:hydantoinase/oxoprolinase family protein [Henriciella aquimarina]
MAKLVGVDIGGTFTDLLSIDDSGEVSFAKARSTPGDLTSGIRSCIEQAEIPLSDVKTLLHGSTVVINAVLERKGAKTALLTTEGFRDVLEIGRTNRPENYNLFFQKPEPFVPRELRFEVTERIGPDGGVIKPLDTGALEDMARKLKDAGVEALAICFLHAYANSDHEEEARNALQALLPDMYITTSSEVAREWREFERFSTAAINAFVGPKVNDYIDDFEGWCHDSGFDGNLYLMRSNGGVMSTPLGRKIPVTMVESGPVAGMIGAGQLGEAMGKPLVVGFDMGGTTAKASLIEDGFPRIVETYYVNGYANGHPLQVPTIEVIEVGTGGGSIAALDQTSSLKIGPRSAGSVPGPVCTGNGGTEPTVTDANALLGRLNPTDYLAGQMTLDLAEAERVMEERIAKPLGLDATKAASGILTIANSNMALAVRGITLEKGVDPRDATLVAFGGGGPLHACSVARSIGISTVIVPQMPACFSALGMLLADMRHDLVQTCPHKLNEEAIDSINESLAELEAEGRERLTESGASDDEIECLFYLDLCYEGQQWTLPTPIEASRLDKVALKAVRERFDELYEGRFGHSFSDLAVNVVNVRVVAVAKRARPSFPPVPARTEGKLSPTYRKVYFDELGFVDCAIYQRNDLFAGDELEGPAIIEEEVCTTLLNKGDRATVDPSGAIIISVGQERSNGHG